MYKSRYAPHIVEEEEEEGPGLDSMFMDRIMLTSYVSSSYLR